MNHPILFTVSLYPTMRVLFFDTETNGLPRYRTSVDAADWPAVVQIAWQVWDFAAETPVLQSACSYIVKPPASLAWDPGSQAIHTISREQALAEGTEPAEVWAEFAEALRTATVLVAHNLAFDKKVVESDATRRGAAPYHWPPHECCTMMLSKTFCRLPSMYPRAEDPYKYPKLSELHALLFGNECLIHFHNASVDVDCTVQCFRRLVELNVISLREWRLAVRAPLREGDP